MDCRTSRATGLILGHLRRFSNPVGDHPVASLPPVPNPQQSRVSGIREVDDAYLGFAGVPAVQAADVPLGPP